MTQLPQDDFDRGRFAGMAAERVRMQPTETAARQLRQLAGEAWESGGVKDIAATLLQLALDTFLDGPVTAWAYADASLSGIDGGAAYRDLARGIVAPLLKEQKR